MDERHYVICELPKTWQKCAGFFTYPIMVINMILLCEENTEKFQKVPIIWFDNPANRFLDDKGKMWSNYFGIRPKLNLEKEFYKIKIFSSDELDHIHHNYGIQAYPYGRGKHAHFRQYYDKPYNLEVDQWYYENRQKGSRIVREYFTVNPAIMEKANETFSRGEEKEKERYTIGVHIRGTDKDGSIGGRKIEPSEYYVYIDYLMKKEPDARIFLATDDPRYFAEFAAKYGKSCFSAENILRSEANVFLDSKVANNYKKGEDVLLDCLCLSKCHFLIHGSSAVSEFAFYFNPDLHFFHFDLQYDCSELIDV
jgi:hypothetical protein